MNIHQSKKIWDVLPPPVGKLAAHVWWKNCLRAQLIPKLSISKKINVEFK